MSSVVPASQETASPPSATVGGVSISGSQEAPATRVALYVDGFNLYHSIDDLNQPHLKWLDLWALGERMIHRGTEQLSAVRYFTAKKPGAVDKNKRHDDYMTALKSCGVQVTKGHFIDDQIECNGCRRVWDAPKEKESDVNLALAVLDDAYQDLFDSAYVLTADSDQAATARKLTERFPAKKFVTVVPPGMEPSKAILTYASSKLKLPVVFLEDCLLPRIKMHTVDGKEWLLFHRPKEYDPPAGWVAPKDRKKP